MLDAARAAFADPDADVSMAEIPRRRGRTGRAVPQLRQSARPLEALYVGEMDAVCQAADTITGYSPRAIIPPGKQFHFYLLDGEMALQLGDQVVIGTSGQLVRIPAGTPHAFAVRTETARVLNFYVPAALDLQVAMLGTPATSAILPPPRAQRPPTTEQEQAFAQRVHDLATQTMSTQQDLLGEYRDHAAAHPNMQRVTEGRHAISAIADAPTSPT